ncbi:phosphatase PAP2 family protein [Microbacterium excoecariae]|uniref:phosphatase PAP2 family protein n=1 Tax=Microbacterium excoecariae TaxID=2715210 RepID=UPI001409C3D8|nr:phosphatase PAP2 family protein [Microbacterium excoecariae]NHI15964.1 phosphatase PAP2 family protein [Microbacterium excoecariae]
MDPRRLGWWGVAALALATALGVILMLGYEDPPGFDQWWNDTVILRRSDAAIAFAQALDRLGGGWFAVLVAPLGIIAALVIARRWRGALFAAGSFAMSAVVVQLLKSLVSRTRPEDMLVASDFGSFPSGHTANATTIAVVLVLLFPRLWVALAGAAWVLAMALSRTLLSVHWATDTLGGILVGAGVPLVLAGFLLPWAWRHAPRRPRAVARE